MNEQWAFQVFKWICVFAGALMLISAALWTSGWALLKTFEMLKVWGVLALCASIYVHGKEYRDQLFWQAVKERAQSGGGEAQRIADFALRQKPEEDFGL